jgi:hypothetical protein
MAPYSVCTSDQIFLERGKSIVQTPGSQIRKIAGVDSLNTAHGTYRFGGRGEQLARIDQQSLSKSDFKTGLSHAHINISNLIAPQ